MSSSDEQEVTQVLEAFDALLDGADGADAPGALAAVERALQRFRDEAVLHHARGLALARLEQFDAAVNAVRRAVELAPREADFLVTLAELQSEVLAFDEAEAVTRRALALNPDHPHGHWLLGFLRDRRGADAAGQEEFEAAARLAPGDYFVPTRFTPEEFDAHVETALGRIPPAFRGHLDNIEIAVELAPARELLEAQRFSPYVLGLFLGTPMTERSLDAPGLPPRVVIYQRNLENSCRTRDELVDEIGITLRHEIGHALGMDEEEIEAAGHG